jgi:hypothetical protein
MRSYVKVLVKTWDLTVWLQHFSNATEYDADIVLDATAHLLGVFGKLIRRHESDEPERCPRCESYKLAEDIQTGPGLGLCDRLHHNHNEGDKSTDSTSQKPSEP